jgi:heme oxygenase
MLDAAPWDGAERARFVDEVSAAFRHNKAVFDDLATPTARAA